MSALRENVQRSNFYTLNSIDPQIKIFYKIMAMSLFYFIDPQHHAKLQEKQMIAL